MKALFISADRYDDAELLVPSYRFLEEGIKVDIASMKKKEPIKGKHGYDMNVTKTLAEVRPDDYDILVLPGGDVAEAVRKEPKAVEIARDFFKKEKPVAAICQGPQTLIAAGLLKGRHATGSQAIVDELISAGAIFVEDEDVVVDGNLVTSRRPADLPAFMRETMKMIRKKAQNLKAA
ncbi:MAG TPA: type 1 glutamine amidotransferase domain-containing protein [Nitrospirota bacterium]|nr:type 1 glutamine amidotransferase domain-containing protein [Nitrospirota bacterium]